MVKNFNWFLLLFLKMLFLIGGRTKNRFPRQNRFLILISCIMYIHLRDTILFFISSWTIPSNQSLHLKIKLTLSCWARTSSFTLYCCLKAVCHAFIAEGPRFSPICSTHRIYRPNINKQLNWIRFIIVIFSFRIQLFYFLLFENIFSN